MSANASSSAQVAVQPVDMKLEVVMIGVSDIDRAKSFYEKLGWRFDGDFAVGHDFRIIQMTPHHSNTSIIFGRGIQSAQRGLADSLILAVDDIEAARAHLIARDVAVSEAFHFAGGPFNQTAENSRIKGRDPKDRPYHTFASFEDPDGNRWLLQEVKTRVPGREWPVPQVQTTDSAALSEFLLDAAKQHDRYEKTHGEHRWSDWYAAYVRARQNGSNDEQATAVANRHMEETLHVLAL